MNNKFTKLNIALLLWMLGLNAPVLAQSGNSKTTGAVALSGSSAPLGRTSVMDQRWSADGRFGGYTPEQELIAKRTRNTKHFQNADGSETVQISASPMHYQDPGGAWQDIDIAILPGGGAKPAYGFRNETNEIKTYFPSAPGFQALSMQMENAAFKLWQSPRMQLMQQGQVAKVISPKPVSGKANQGKITYPELYPDISEEFEIIDNGLENNTIIQKLPAEISALQPDATVAFSQFIPLPAGARVMNADLQSSTDFDADQFSVELPGRSNTVYFGAIVVFDQDVSKEDALLFCMEPGKLSPAEKARGEQHVYKGKYRIHFVSGGIEVAVCLPASWLQDGSRAFPVVVDPTVTITPPSALGDYHGPMTHWYGYQRHADLYLQSEIGNFGSITAIEYNATNTSASGNKPTKVYMRTTTATTVSSAAWNSATYTGTGAQLCLDGNTDQGSTSGWKMLTLTTPFTYNSDNLLVMVYDAYGGSGSSKYYSRGTVSPNRQAYFRQDGTDPGDGVTMNTENYLSEIRITYDFLTACSGQPTAGTVPDTLHVCAGDPFMLTATGATSAGGMTNQWQARNPSVTGTWTDISGASFANYNVASGITSATDYRYITTCNGSSLSDTSTVIYAVMNPATQCYCTPSVTYNTSYYITSFSTTLGAINITNNNTSYSPGGYVDYSGSDTVSGTQGTNIDFSLTTSSGYVTRGIYVDWNQNGNFTDPGEEVYTSGYPTTPYTLTTATGTIQIPVTALPGDTRMRVRSAYYYSTVIDPCDNLSYGESEDYTFNVIQATPCASVTFPASVDAEVDRDTLCVSGDINLSLSTAMPVASGITYQWQSSPNGTTWTDIGTPQMLPELTVTGISSATDYRCEILCSGTVTLTSSLIHIHVNNPQLSGTPQGGTRCGPGTVDLSATATSGNTINWYDVPVGGLPLGSGPNFTTPYISTTTDFYVAPTTGSSPATVEIGTGTSSTTYSPPGGPFNNYYRNESTQMLYTASEIIANGGGAGILTSIAFNCTEIPTQTVGGTNTVLPNYRISVATVPAGTTTLSWQPAGNFTQVYYSAGFTPNLGWNTFSLTTPFPWNGVDNIVIQVCYDQTQPGYSYGGTHEYTTVSGRMMYYNDDGVATGCGMTGASTATYLPNVHIGMTVGCEGPRQAVTATVTPGPAFAIDYDSVLCNDAVRPISVSSPVGNYSSYVWTPTTNLYTNAAGTIAYTGGNASTVYFKSNVSGEYTYAVAATNGPLQTDCAAADTAVFWVQPGAVTISARPDTICVTGATELELIPDSNYYPGTIQWQESTDGVTYTDIAGANAETYSTSILTTDHYYKALVSAQTGVCESPDKHILIANPDLISANDSFNCGPGSVTLQAQVGVNTNARWYPDMTSNQPLGMGSPFVTPPLSVTDTFYVSSGTGTPQPDPTYMGSGTSTYNYAYTPYYKGYEGSVCEWLIKASELQGAGFAAGNIISIGFDVSSVGDAVQDFRFSMGLTTLTSLPANFQTGLTPVYTVSSYQPVAGDNVHILDNSFYWDGTSNVIIQRCVQNTSTGTSTYVTYETSAQSSNYEYANAANQCSAPTGFVYTTTARPNIQIGMEQGCESDRQPVIAHIYPQPQVDLGNDINQCVDSGSALVLNAGLQPDQPTFLWDNGGTDQVRSVNQSGTYYVTVTNQYTCVGSDTVSINLRYFPEVELGNDTTVCEGITVTLDAGDDGIEYFWNTGEDAREIIVDNSGSYNVLVTNDQGCVGADTVTVTMSGQLPTVDGILVLNDGEDSFVFNALNAQNVAGYEWDFGDGSPHSFLQAPKHKYPADGNYLVTLKLSSSCGYIMDSTAAHIVGIHDLNLDKNELSIYPNPTSEKATIVNKGAGIRMEQVEVFTVLGRKVYSEKADSPGRHELSLSGFAAGMYTVRIQTNKGNVARKLELIK